MRGIKLVSGITRPSVTIAIPTDYRVRVHYDILEFIKGEDGGDDTDYIPVAMYNTRQHSFRWVLIREDGSVDPNSGEYTDVEFIA